MKKLKVALIQFNPKSYEVEANVKKALKFAKEASSSGAELIVFPELFDSGYCVEDRDNDFALDLKHFKGYTLELLSEFAKEHKTYIVANGIEKAKSKLFDTAFIIDKKGKLLGKYRKIYLWGDESKRFGRGNKYDIFELKFDKFKVKIGLQICYEIGFGEGARFLALQGAEVLIYPAAFGEARSYVWDLASKARALENGAFILANNRSGSEISKLNSKELKFAGRSKIINPKGEVIAHIQDEEGVVISEINIEEIKEQRANLPYLKDLNTSLNQKILKKINLNTKEKKWQKKF